MSWHIYHRSKQCNTSIQRKNASLSKRIFDMSGYKQMLINEEENEGKGFIDYSDISIDDERY